jgi:hypothetical protein
MGAVTFQALPFTKNSDPFHNKPSFASTATPLGSTQQQHNTPCTTTNPLTMQQQHTSLKSQAIVQPVLQNQIVGRVQQQPSPKSQSPKKQMTDSTFVNGKMTQTQFEQLCKHHLIDFTKGRNARDPEYGRTLLMMLIRKRWF